MDKRGLADKIMGIREDTRMLPHKFDKFWIIHDYRVKTIDELDKYFENTVNCRGCWTSRLLVEQSSRRVYRRTTLVASVARS